MSRWAMGTLARKNVKCNKPQKDNTLQLNCTVCLVVKRIIRFSFLKNPHFS